MSANRTTQHARDGFTLIEVVVAMAILSAVLVMLAGMTFATAQRSVDLQIAGARQAVMLKEINRLTALPLDELTNQSGCHQLSSGPDDFESCITIETPRLRTRRVTVVLTSDRPGVRPDTVRFTRTEPPSANPFNCSTC